MIRIGKGQRQSGMRNSYNRGGVGREGKEEMKKRIEERNEEEDRGK